MASIRVIANLLKLHLVLLYYKASECYNQLLREKIIFIDELTFFSYVSW